MPSDLRPKAPSHVSPHAYVVSRGSPHPSGVSDLSLFSCVHPYTVPHLHLCPSSYLLHMELLVAPLAPTLKSPRMNPPLKRLPSPAPSPRSPPVCHFPHPYNLSPKFLTAPPIPGPSLKSSLLPPYPIPSQVWVSSASQAPRLVLPRPWSPILRLHSFFSIPKSQDPGFPRPQGGAEAGP